MTTRILTKNDLSDNSGLFREMFEARTAIFSQRLGWEVQVSDGLECDHYDELDDVIYVVSFAPDGRMNGSLRLLPTTGETMLKSEFRDFFAEPVDVISPSIIECTRFCVHPTKIKGGEDVISVVSSELSIGLCDLCLRSGYDTVVGLYDARMTRVYRRIGWMPEVLAESRTHRGHLCVGLWNVSETALTAMRDLADDRLQATLNRTAA